MPRERDYGREYERAQQIAYAIGYDSAAQRRAIRSAETPEELKANLEPVLRQRAAEGDNQSLGNIYADIYDIYDFDQEFDDVWAEIDY